MPHLVPSSGMSPEDKALAIAKVHEFRQSLITRHSETAIRETRTYYWEILSELGWNPHERDAVRQHLLILEKMPLLRGLVRRDEALQEMLMFLMEEYRLRMREDFPTSDEMHVVEGR